MKPVNKKRKASLIKRRLRRTFLLLGLTLSCMISLVLLISIYTGGNRYFGPFYYSKSPGGKAYVTANVLKWEPLVHKYAIQNGIENETGLMLALIQQESGGSNMDIMQASESLGLKPNSISSPEMSIKIGVGNFAKTLKLSGGDINLTLQSYNFGRKFIFYAKDHGGYSKKVTSDFSKMMASKKGWERYGDPYYVDHVLRYYKGNKS